MSYPSDPQFIFPQAGLEASAPYTITFDQPPSTASKTSITAQTSAIDVPLFSIQDHPNYFPDISMDPSFFSPINPFERSPAPQYTPFPTYNVSWQRPNPTAGPAPLSTPFYSVSQLSVNHDPEVFSRLFFQNTLRPHTSFGLLPELPPLPMPTFDVAFEEVSRAHGTSETPLRRLSRYNLRSRSKKGAGPSKSARSARYSPYQSGNSSSGSYAADISSSDLDSENDTDSEEDTPSSDSEIVPSHDENKRFPCQWEGPDACSHKIGGQTHQVLAHLLKHHFEAKSSERKRYVKCLWGQTGGCGEVVRLKSLGSHISACHLASVEYSCSACGRTFARKDSALRHTRSKQSSGKCPKNVGKGCLRLDRVGV